jgi:hypothetical protein
VLVPVPLAMPVELCALPVAAAPVPDGVAALFVVAVLPEFPFSAPLARAAGEGAVRTTVAVSLRGTAFRLASVASCGDTPIVDGADAAPAGAAVWAKAPDKANASTALTGISLT